MRRHCEERQYSPRHCEERQYFPVVMARSASIPRRHCEERSDAAIQDFRVHGLPRCARNDDTSMDCRASLATTIPAWIATLRLLVTKA